jgi:hypothetical protein
MAAKKSDYRLEKKNSFKPSETSQLIEAKETITKQERSGDIHTRAGDVISW